MTNLPEKSERRETPPASLRGEYLPAEKPAKPARKRSVWFPLVLAVAVLLLVFFGTQIGRQWYDSLLARIDRNKIVHPDRTQAQSGIRPQVRPSVALVYRSQDGQRVRVLADAAQYSAFVQVHSANLEKARLRVREHSGAALRGQLEQVFAVLDERVERFADWYFAYATTYQLMWEALTSATQHALASEAQSLSDAVAYDVEKYLHRHYESIVLRPEVTDPQVRNVYRQALEQAHARYLDVVALMQADFQVFVANHTRHLDAGLPAPELVLDWDSQFNKISMADYEKGAKGASLGAALAAGGGLAGKAIGGAAGKGVAGKAAASAAGKGVFAKLASPFVSKAVLAGGGGAVGALGGPVGSVIGVAAGLGVDYLISEGVELVQREQFVADVHDALATTRQEWERELQLSLEQAIDVWFEDTLNLLPRFEP